MSKKQRKTKTNKAVETKEATKAPKGTFFCQHCTSRTGGARKGTNDPGLCTASSEHVARKHAICDAFSPKPNAVAIKSD